MPSIRSLSVPLGVNPMTISKAYNLLVHEGVLERRPGLPLVVAEQSAGELANRRRDQLRTNLLPAAKLAHGMGLSADEAVRVFRELLEETAEEGGEDS
jgi:GntR family transcriptional regulator